jgi:pimeloyl-ACP methyl ester carboxylesterase
METAVGTGDQATRLWVATAPDVDLDVAVVGAGAPLLLLHGFPDNRDLWQALVPALAAHHRLWMPDLRGYRQSSKPPLVDDYSLHKLVADVRVLADKASCSPNGRVCVAGHDWGGMLAWAFAALHPERVERLVIFNAPHPCRFAELLRTDAAQQAASSYVQRLAAPGAEDAMAANGHERMRLLMQQSLPRMSPDDLQNLAAGWAVPGALPAMLNWYRALDIHNPHAVPNVSPASGDIAAPTLLLWGERDGAFVPDNLLTLERWVPHLTLRRFADAGHWLPREKPVEVAAAMLAFLSAQS